MDKELIKMVIVALVVVFLYDKFIKKAIGNLDLNLETE